MKRYIKSYEEIYKEHLTKDQIISELQYIKYNLNEDGDIDLYTDDGLDVYIFWHSPSYNLTWYPIVQIDYNGKTIFHREGSENSNYYYKVIDEAIQKIKTLK